MNRLWIFVLFSLLLHGALFVSMSRVSLRVPETSGSGPVKVTLVSAVESDGSERTGEKEEEKRSGILAGRDQDNIGTPKETAEPEKSRNRAETALLKTKDNQAAVLPGESPPKPLKPKKSEELAETGKHRETTPQATTATNPGEIPADDAVQTAPGGGTKGPEGERTGHAERENADTGQTRQSPVPSLITDDLVVEKTLPVYPLIARRRGQEGRVILRVALSADGSVKNIVVEESSGFDVLDKSALQAVNHWLFSRDAPKTVLVPVTFRLQ